MLASRRLVIGPICNEWSLTYLGVMVLIWVPLSKRAIQLSPFILNLVMILTLCQCWKGSGFKKGVCWGDFMPQEPLSVGSFTCLLLLEWSRLPSLMLSPPGHLTAFFPQCLYEQAIMDEMFQAATMVAAFLICLGILYSPCQAYHKLFHNSLDSAGIVTLLVFIVTSILFFQMHQTHSRLFWDGLVALEFLQGEETGSPWFGRSIVCLSPWPLGQLHGVFLLSFSGDL